MDFYYRYQKNKNQPKKIYESKFRIDKNKKMNEQLDRIWSSTSSVNNNNEYYEHLKHLKKMHQTFFNSPNIALTWENVNVNRKCKMTCFCLNANTKEKEVFEASDQPTQAFSSFQPNFLSDLAEKSSESSISSTEIRLEMSTSHILVNANGIIRSGECLAIMGASGAGKSTLLNVLNFRNLNKLSVNAKVNINGKVITELDLAKRAAYIQQDDLFIPNITVKEHLIFLAMLKMGSAFSNKQKRDRVEEILVEFNLRKCQNSKIGGVNNEKGISGGEKRRLSIASEILTDPQILFCDEPISGLDSHMALMIVNKLANLARQGKIVICTIHQPSSQVFERFDKLCLLSEGRTVYFGSREQAFEFFSRFLTD